VIDLLLDLVLPRTDRAVAIQWAVMAPIWLVALIAIRRVTPNKDYRQFVYGLVIMNLAWFGARMIH
jgi:hypothetical protein